MRVWRQTMTACPSEWLRGAVFAAALRLSILGKPVPKPEVIKGHFGAFYPKTYTQWRESALTQIAEQTQGHPKITSTVAVGLEVVITPPKAKTTRKAPPGDTDNHSKSALDALTRAGVWEDDTLVLTEIITKRWANPGEPEGLNIWISAMPA
jgi:Holliday junction resolvase RusA-like endonuclease